MNDTGRFVVFLTVVLGTWSLMHAYVGWRLWGAPGFASPWGRRGLLAGLVLLWLIYPLARVLSRIWPGPSTAPLEFAGACWVGALFLLVVCLSVADAGTLFGRVFSKEAPAIRLWAVAAASALSLAALLQGLRPPVVCEHECRLEHLPPELDGTVLVQLSDLHIGTILGERWLDGIVSRVDALQPDLVVLTGDLLDSSPGELDHLLPVLEKLKAPLGVWAVTGNHEYYAGLETSVAFMERAGFTVLRDESRRAAPGLVLAGVDDLTARRQFGIADHAVRKALENRPPGAAVFLCHSPMEVKEAARLGAGLMLSGHTHGGQIWPFGWVVRLAYKYVAGCYEVGGMKLLVSRGTGTWGPRMRLFGRGEIQRVVLRSEGEKAGSEDAGSS